MKLAAQRSRSCFALLILAFVARATSGLAAENDTQCFRVAFSNSPPASLKKGQAFMLDGALLLSRPSEYEENGRHFGSPAFRANKGDKIIALQAMQSSCGVSLEGWVWVSRLGRRYLMYSAF